MIHGLILGCPYELEHKDCPFIETRKLPVEERIEFVEKLNEMDICDLIEYHSRCLYFREKKVIKIIKSKKLYQKQQFTHHCEQSMAI